MLKKSSSYKGYLLLESLVALGLLCIIIGSYISLNTLLLRKNRQATEQLMMHRVLYEEMKSYENYGEESIQGEHLSNSSYQVRFDNRNNKLVEVEITNGKEGFILKKE
ncbi:Tfp pilus assembly protein PilV [Enterococcus rotai]|uniref:N-terminal cleavage protein n=1 Tax=Enterococcus rotai TaxID=118060 RepID=A0A0U2MXE6_9ENTE|nr:competence type IV pilus minor pilin ComGE [Enterococcus rotai]ALS37443.1 hypothetical protein ATZ35_09845 [Enterococcus rotai]